MRSGEKYGRLTVIRFVKMVWRGDHNLRLWQFRCDCGTELFRVGEYVQQSLKSGNSPCCEKCHRTASVPPRTEPKRLDLVGQKLGKLTAIEPTGRVDKKRYAIWRFQCECGDIVEKSASAVLGSLKNGQPPNCGKQCCNNHPKLEPGESVKKQVIYAYRKNAGPRKLEFELTDDQIEALFSGRCYYCGIEPVTVARRKAKYGAFVYNGIDRIDNTKGYIPGNVVSCCKICNHAKNNLPYEEFMEWIKRLIRHQSGI